MSRLARDLSLEWRKNERTCCLELLRLGRRYSIEVMREGPHIRVTDGLSQRVRGNDSDA